MVGEEAGAALLDECYNGPAVGTRDTNSSSLRFATDDNKKAKCDLLTGWPGEGAAGEEMEVKVGDGLAAVGASVGDDAVAFWVVLLGVCGGGFEEVAEEVGGGCGDVCEVLFGDEEEVGGRLGIYVWEGEDLVVFEDGFHGDLVGGDFAEEAVWHRGILAIKRRNRNMD